MTTTVSACKIVGATPEHPCFCSCHPGKECMDCLCGRHKLKSTPTHSPTETPTLKEAQDACKSYYEPSGQLRGCTCGTCPTNPPTETGKAIGYLSDCCNDPNGYTDITNGCNRCGKCDKPCKIHPPTSPTVEKWRENIARWVAENDSIAEGYCYFREWNESTKKYYMEYCEQNGLFDLLSHSLQEAKAETIEKIHKALWKKVSPVVVGGVDCLPWNKIVDLLASLKQEDGEV